MYKKQHIFLIFFSLALFFGCKKEGLVIDKSIADCQQYAFEVPQIAAEGKDKIGEKMVLTATSGNGIGSSGFFWITPQGDTVNANKITINALDVFNRGEYQVFFKAEKGSKCESHKNKITLTVDEKGGSICTPPVNNFFLQGTFNETYTKMLHRIENGGYYTIKTQPLDYPYVSVILNTRAPEEGYYEFQPQLPMINSGRYAYIEINGNSTYTPYSGTRLFIRKNSPSEFEVICCEQPFVVKATQEKKNVTFRFFCD